MKGIVCNREIRVIPKGWQHPEGRFLVQAELYPETPEAQKEWVEDFEGDTLPDRSEFMPSVAELAVEQTEIMAYETTSEGSPISPAFPNSQEGRVSLIRYCAENCHGFGGDKTSEEAWAVVLFGKGYSLVNVADGRIVSV